MTRLPFLLPDFTRIIWHNAQAREVWGPRISRITHAWGEIERLAVADDIRKACLTFCTPDALPAAAHWAAQRGLMLFPLARHGMTAQYSATPKSVEQDKPWQYRVVVIQAGHAAEWSRAWEQSDNRTIGRLLGYPSCCRDFFERVWVEEHSVDTTWQMALRGLETNAGPNFAEVSGPAEANILLRWLGVRLVPHLPCAFDCEATVEFGVHLAAVGRHAGFEQEVEWMYEMLEWPAEWSALHGIAEIRTPILTISTRTDATAQKLAVRRPGAQYPEEGASGLHFPFRIVKDKVTAGPSFKRSVTPVWELNGFGSEEFMEHAHDTLLSALPEKHGFLIDLGCGTGRLLERAQDNGWSAVGVEIDNARAGAARVASIRRGDMFDLTLWQGEFDVVIVMPGRLLEGISVEKADAFRAALQDRTRYVLLYAYGDWLEKHGGLGPLAAAAGFGDLEVVHHVQVDGVEAALVTYYPVQGEQHEKLQEGYSAGIIRE